METAAEVGLTPDQSAFLRTVVLVLSPVSVLSGLFVFLTFTLFEEKRQVASWANTALFVLSALLVDLLLLLGGAVGLDVLADESNAFCKVQGSLLMLFGSSMIVFFFVITVHLYLRICRPNIDIRPAWLVTAGIVVPVVMTIPPVVADVVAFDGVWCFIKSDETLYIYLNFYGPMGIACVLGAFMWVAIILRMSMSMNAVTAPVSAGSVNYGSKEAAPVQPSAEDQANMKTQLMERRRLLMRQLAFVTVFELIFFTFFANRLSVTVSGNSFGGWIFHTFAMCSCGIFTFLIFGLKQSNFELWYDALMALCTSRPAYQRI